MKKRILLLNILIVWVLVWSINAGLGGEKEGIGSKKKEPIPSTKIEVTGVVKKPCTVNLNVLKSMKAVTIKVAMTGSHCGYLGTYSYTGVLLRDIISKAGLEDEAVGAVILIYGTDGFYVAISWGELFRSEAGSQIMIAYERDSNPLGPDEGFARLIIPTDKYTASRSVSRVNKIEVKYGGGKVEREKE